MNNDLLIQDRQSDLSASEDELLKLREALESEMTNLKADSSTLTNLRAEHSRLKASDLSYKKLNMIFYYLDMTSVKFIYIFLIFYILYFRMTSEAYSQLMKNLGQSTNHFKVIIKQ